jgi:hypothetical protein
VGRRDRSLLRGEAKELGEKIRTELAFIPDAQATSIAAAISAPVETVQRALVMVSSGVAQTIKFVCLLAGGMIWPRRNRFPVDTDRFHQGGGTDGGGGTEMKPKPPAEPALATDAISVPAVAASSRVTVASMRPLRQQARTSLSSPSSVG